MRMRHAISTMIGILAMLGILPGTTLWAPGPAAARAEDVPLASSLQLESVMLVGGWASAGPFIPVIGDGTAHLAYGYYLTNYGKKAARIVSLRVRGIGGAAFATTIEGDALKSSFTPGAAQSRQRPDLRLAGAAFLRTTALALAGLGAAETLRTGLACAGAFAGAVALAALAGSKLIAVK